ncbi:MAG: cobyrinate a,c-diamide synthase [Pseudomonadota bacterium]
MRGLVIAAPASGQGKTTVTLGLLGALRRAGWAVAAAKSGPDYIDPAFHAAATGRASVNLDPWACDVGQLRARAAAQGPADLLVVEGAMGLHDGADDGSAGGHGGTADLAAALGLPVVLVLDAAGAGQGIAAVVDGVARWRQDVPIAGVLLNRVGSPRHAALLRRALQDRLPVFGCLPRCPVLALPSRHLGLVQACETEALPHLLAAAAAWVADAVNLDSLAAAAGPISGSAATVRHTPPLGQRIAVASDAAFAFAYPHHLSDWREQGAEILPFSPLADHGPDAAADAVFLPGGYPELHGGRLASAVQFRAGMAAAADRGAIIYGECGGYMVLGEGLTDADCRRHRMLGLLGLETSFAERRLHLGYRRLRALAGPFGGAAFAGHEFHYATTLSACGEPLFAAQDAASRALPAAGLTAGRVMGSFAHLIEALSPARPGAGGPP